MPKKIFFAVGTRPEAIKLAPLIHKFNEHKGKFKSFVCSTGQHREMLDQVFDFFKIKPDHTINLERRDASLFDLSSIVLKKLESILSAIKPDLVVVQGDTSTAFIAALAAYYAKIPVAHVEAGLRSNNKYSPFPEEINRALIGRIADFHFAPTKAAREILIKENSPGKIYVVGNTVIDALFFTLKTINKTYRTSCPAKLSEVDFSKRIVLVTGHRRESFGEPLKRICLALKEIPELFPDVRIIYPVHMNTNVRLPVKNIIGGCAGIHLTEPLSYPEMVWLMDKSFLIVTDSGGIQEEAPSLGKPVLVTRDVTERMEGVRAGNAILVGTKKQKIIDAVVKLLTNKVCYKRMSNSINPYGDGKTSERICRILDEALQY